MLFFNIGFVFGETMNWEHNDNKPILFADCDINTFSFYKSPNSVTCYNI